MTTPRRFTPPSAPVTPRDRPPVASAPWDLAEFKAPVPPFGAASGGAGGHFSSSELTALREQMQEQNTRVVAEARRTAFEEGRAAGRAEAQQAADQRVVSAVDALAAAATTIRQHEEHYAGVLEENLTALACGIARQIINREVQLEPSAIRSLVQEALAAFPQESTLRVRLNPLDHVLLVGDSSYPDITWISDQRLVRGGCVVEGRERIVDGRIDLALEQIFRSLTGTDA